MLIFLLSGFWHGADWTFILWGFFHGIFMILEKIIKDLWKKLDGIVFVNRIMLFVGKIIGVTYTFLFINLTWVLFRASTIKQAKIFVGKLFLLRGRLLVEILEKANNIVEIRVLSRLGIEGMLEKYPQMLSIIFMIVLCVAVFFGKNTQEKMKQDKYGVWRSLLTITLIVWAVLSFSDVSEFLYFNF